jgi:hypothetical protein
VLQAAVDNAGNLRLFVSPIGDDFRGESCKLLATQDMVLSLAGDSRFCRRSGWWLADSAAIHVARAVDSTFYSFQGLLHPK